MKRIAMIAGLILASASAVAAEPVAAPATLPAQTAALPPSEAALGAAVAADRLGDALFAVLVAAEPKANVVVSPYNLSEALNLLAQGAGGKTRADFERGLRLADGRLSLDGAASAMTDLRQALKPSGAVTLDTANGIWAARKFVLRDDYAAMAARRFDAEARTVDFADPAALAGINHWASERTHGKIPQILAELPTGTRLVIAGALYLKGAWRDKFDAALTRPATFARQNAKSAEVAMMHRKAEMAYLETPLLQAVALPLADPRFEVTIVLPKPGAEVAMQAALTEDSAALLGAMKFRKRTGALALPRLKLAWSGDVLEALKKAGLGAALGEGADFGRLCSQPIAVKMVVHKTVFEIDEEGATAAAATAVVVTRSVAVEAPFAMTVDRPFYFVLRDRLTGAALFIGHVVDPAAGKVD